MSPCDTHRPLLLESLYGLLDPADAAALDRHLEGCADCTAARAEAARYQGLMATAALGSFPEVRFVPPVDAPAPATTVSQPTEYPPVTVTSVCVRWVVAATLLLAVAGLAAPAARDAAGVLWYRSALDARTAEVIRAEADRDRSVVAQTDAVAAANKQITDARSAHDALVTEWVKADEGAVAAAAARPFTIHVQGPSAAVAGAPNQYAVRVTDPQQRPKPVKLRAVVRDAGGAVRFEYRTPAPAADATVTLPAAMWDGVTPGGELTLTVTATDPANGAVGEVHEDVRLLAPLYTTYLTTDKPLYRPGEAVYFRSLTLDRTRFLPPDRDLNLRFEVTGPNGQQVPEMTVAGSSRPVAPTPAGGFAPVLGPDGRPVRGVGTGAFALPPDLDGGTYRLTVSELSPAPAAPNPPQIAPLAGPDRGRPPPGAVFPRAPDWKVLAERKFTVLKYTPDRFEKTLEFDARSYGPGDTVQAKFVVRDQGKPVAKMPVRYEVQAHFRNQPPIPVAPELAPEQTDAAGAAAVRFTLPASGELVSATLNVIAGPPGATESVLRPVPLADRALALEFLPEGGDLVTGVENRVYFRATGRTTGKPVDVIGVLTDGTRVVCPVRTLTDPDRPGVNQGLGVFTFTPEAGKRYAVRVDRPIGVEPPPAVPFAVVMGQAAAVPLAGDPLPPAKTSGVVLTIPDGVTKAGDPLRVRLSAVGAKRSLLVGMYTRGRPVTHKRVTVEPGRPTDVTLDAGGSTLGGVTRVTVFEEPAADAAGRSALTPVAERLVYRRPAETLRLGFTATTPGGGAGPFVPGSPVELTVTATDEAGRPKPAVLLAAVVNQSVVAMADEKTARSLPTHFLLGAEVRGAAELENADVLLTDHPKAAAGLDLLLGTQGWRRFAEQDTRLFQRQAPSADTARLLVALGATGPVPAGWRDGVQRVADEYRPRYEAAEWALNAAEQAVRTGAATQDADQAKTQADNAYSASRATLDQVAADVKSFDAAMTTRANVLPALLIAVFGLGVVCLVARFARPAGAPERRPLTVGGLGFVALGLFLLLAVVVSRGGNDRWRKYARDPAAVNYNYATRTVPTPAPGVTAGPEVGGATVAMQADPPKAPGVKRPGPDDGPREMRPNAKFGPNSARTMARPVAPPSVDRPALAGRRPNPVVPVRLPPYTGRGAQDEHRLLRAELNALVSKAAGANDPAAAAMIRRAKSDIEGQFAAAPPLVVREYAHERPVPGPDGAVRADFAETVLWQPVLVVPDSGRATVSFTLPDAVNGYQVVLAGHTLDGRLGAATGTIEVRKPLVIEPKLPQQIGSADKLDVPLGLTNGTDAAQTAAVTLKLKGLKAEGDGASTVTVPARGGARAVVRLAPEAVAGTLTVRATATADELTDAVERTLTVVPDGFPAEGVASATLDRRARVSLPLPPRWEKGTLAATVTVYPNTLAELQAGLAGLLREPSGCFEQTSTANYPNVMVTRYLKDAGRADPDVARQARDLMDRGYGRLTGFECPKGGGPDRVGYEWFGAADRPHLALTAYGLLQFADMSAVHPVDPDMLRRTKQFLLDRRDGSGSFTRTAADTGHLFGRAPDHVVDAYVVWAVSEADRGSAAPADLSREVDALLALAAAGGKPAKDPYFLGLVANALLNTGRRADGVALLSTIAALQGADGSVPGGETDIVTTTGKPLVIESTALAALGWLRVDRPDLFAAKVRTAVGWISGQRDPGGAFGSTQPTVLALKALIEYARANRRPAEGGDVRVSTGGREIGAAAFTASTTTPVTVVVPEAALKAGANELVIETTATQPYPVSVAWSYRTRQPESSDRAAVSLTTKLSRPELAEGESARLDVTVANRLATPQGMAVAIIGLPAGLTLPPDVKQLTALTARPADGSEPTVSYWEVRGRELILYWRGLAPKQTVSLGLDLVAAVPGEYRGPASRAYLYYNAELKSWVEPLAVTIRPR